MKNKEKTMEWYLETPKQAIISLRIGLIIGLLSAFVSILLCLIGKPLTTEMSLLKTTSFISIAVGTICGLLGSTAASSVLTLKSETLWGHKIAFDRSGDIIAQIVEKKSARTVWKKRWEEFCKNYIVETYKAGATAANMKCAPITANPKVREIAYSILARLFDNPEEFAEQRKRFGTSSVEDTEAAANKALRCQMYDFNEKHSKQLAEFSNPLKKEQQDKFQTLVFNFLQPFATTNKIALLSATFEL